MAKSYKRGGQSKSKTMSMRGGNYPPSAWGSVLGTVGDGWTQFRDALMLQPGESSATSNSNLLVPIKNLNAQESKPSIGSNFKGGRRRHSRAKRRHSRAKRRHSRAKRGGNLAALGSVVNQAAVPGALFVAQQMYGKRRESRRKRH